VCCVLCAVCCVLCAVCCVLCAVCCVLCACMLCAVCCVLCACVLVCCVLCALRCVLCAAHGVLHAVCCFGIAVHNRACHTACMHVRWQSLVLVPRWIWSKLPSKVSVPAVLCSIRHILTYST